MKMNVKSSSEYAAECTDNPANIRSFAALHNKQISIVCKRQDKMKVNKFCAFTLAEVLITLGIIGVVAVLTIPPLIQSYKKQVAATRIKKFYSIMSQAILRAELDNGPVDTWNYNQGNNDENEAKRIEEYTNTYIVPYFNGITRKPGFIKESDDADAKLYYYLNDGSAFTIHEGTCVDIRYDYNAEAKPNTYGKDKFAFLLCHRPELYTLTSSNYKFAPYCLDCQTREKALQACKSKGKFCAGILFYDNWEFKDDYPYKL